MAATRTRGSDSPPGASTGRRRWRQLAEVFVLRRPDQREDLGGSTRQIETRDVGGPPFVGRLPVVVYRSNAHLAATIAGHSGESSRRGFQVGKSEAKAGPFLLLRLMR